LRLKNRHKPSAKALCLYNQMTKADWHHIFDKEERMCKQHNLNYERPYKRRTGLIGLIIPVRR